MMMEVYVFVTAYLILSRMNEIFAQDDHQEHLGLL